MMQKAAREFAVLKAVGSVARRHYTAKISSDGKILQMVYALPRDMLFFFNEGDNFILKVENEEPRTQPCELRSHSFHYC
jgi:hypothetical protein